MSDSSFDSVPSSEASSLASSPTSSSILEDRRDSRPSIVYSKDFLLNLQFSPQSLVKPEKLPNLAIICDQVGILNCKVFELAWGLKRIIETNFSLIVYLMITALVLSSQNRFMSSPAIPDGSTKKRIPW